MVQKLVSEKITCILCTICFVVSPTRYYMSTVASRLPRECVSTIRLKSRKGYFLLLYILEKYYHLSLWTCVQCDTITQRYTVSQTENLNIHYYQSKVYSKKASLGCHIIILQIQAISLIHLKKRSEKGKIKSNAIFCPLLISVHHAQTSRHC